MVRSAKDISARLTSPKPSSQPHHRQKGCEFRGNQALRASNCNGGVNPLSASTANAEIVESLMSCGGWRKKATTHVLQAIVAIVQVLQSMIMTTNVDVATDIFALKILAVR
jgi:hypothetical protein